MDYVGIAGRANNPSALLGTKIGEMKIRWEWRSEKRRQWKNIDGSKARKNRHSKRKEELRIGDF